MTRFSYKSRRKDDRLNQSALTLPRPGVWVLLLALAALLVPVLAACSGDDDDPTPTSTGTATGTAAGTATGAATGTATGTATTSNSDAGTGTRFPVVIEHKYGETEISAEPERVVALGYNEQDALLALGVKPVASRYWFGDEPFAVFPWAQDELGGAEPEVLEMPFGELDYEAIASLEPDLISAVYSGITEDEYDRLSAIARTTAQTDDYIDFGMHWQEATVLIGHSVGMKAKAEDMVAALEARFEEVRQAHPEWQGASVAVVAPRNDGQVGIFASGDLRSRFFESLGFVVPAEFDEIAGASFFANVSMERADLLDQDLVVFHQLSYLEGGREAVQSDPLWNGLDAIQEGRAIYLDVDLDSAYGFNSVLSMGYFLDGVVPLIEDALGGQ